MKKKIKWGQFFLSAYGGLFLSFIYAPILLISVYSCNANPVNMMIWEGFTFDWYRTIFGFPTRLDELTLYVESTDKLYSAVLNSLTVASITTGITLNVQ